MRERLVAAGGLDAVRLGEQCGFQLRRAAAPPGDFQARAEFRFQFVKRVRKQTRQQRRALRAFHELRRAREQSEHEARQRGVRNVSGGDVDEQLRTAGDCGAQGFVLGGRCGRFIEALGVAEVLRDQRLQMCRRELPEKLVQTAGQRGLGKTGRRRAEFQRELAKGGFRLQPAFRHLGDHADQVVRRAAGEILRAVALQRLAGLGDHRGGQRGFRQQVRQKNSSAGSSRIACRKVTEAGLDGFIE